MYARKKRNNFLEIKWHLWSQSLWSVYCIIMSSFIHSLIATNKNWNTWKCIERKIPENALKELYSFLVYAKVFLTTQDIRSCVINKHRGPNEILSDQEIWFCNQKLSMWHFYDWVNSGQLSIIWLGSKFTLFFPNSWSMLCLIK